LMEIENVVLNHSASLFNWELPGLGARYRFESIYLSPVGRDLFTDGRAEFVPVSYYRMGVLPPGLDNFNVFLMKVSPPDQEGFVNFGDVQIMSKLQARNANLVIAEIDPTLVRIGGDNSIHVSEIDWLVERSPAAPALPTELPPAPEEEQRIVAAICET